MNIIFYIYLFIFGTMFGSFASVLIYRLKSGEDGILTGRSHCPKCNNILQTLELIPIFSWLKNLGKCHYCKEKISNIYPFLELSTGILFSLIGYFLIDYNLIYSLDYFEITKLILWLSIGFITILYTFYDLLFLEIHDGIMLSGISLGFIMLSFDTFLNNSLFFSISSILMSISIIGLLYIIMIKELKEVWDVLIIVGIILSLIGYKLYFGIDLTSIAIFDGLIASLIIFIFFFLQILVSKGAWMGGGDLRIAIMIGLLLGTGLVFPSLMTTYLIGSIIGISYVIYGKIKKNGTTINSQVPFGPFLAIGFFITLFYSDQIFNLMNIYL